MKKASILIFVLALMLLTSVSVGNASDYVYVTTNMTWSEFYTGELGAKASDLSVSYDAVSTATQRFINRFEGFTSEVSGDGTVFGGVKNVQVRMTSDVYGALSDASRFSNPINGTFSEYKEMDASGAFGAMTTETIDANAKLPNLKLSIGGGKSQGHGNYRITISGLNYASLDVDLGTSNDNFLGAKLETTDGTVYGLKPLHNLWIRGDMAEQIGFCVEDFAERNGTHLSYAHTASLPGKTISKVTYMLKNQPDIVITCNLPVKFWSDASIIPGGIVKAGSNVEVPLLFNDLPPDSTGYTLASVARVVGRSSTPLTAGTDYTYSENTLTFTKLEPGNYTATFTNEDYVDIVASIPVYAFATTDMTWAEFYAGEVGGTSSDLYAAGLDAISSPTARVASRFSQLTSVSNDKGGRDITGVAAVKVRMGEAVYNVLSNDSRYTFSDEAFIEYKDVNADGSFGKMETETHVQEGATVALTSPGTWGDYQLSVSSIDVKVSSGDEYYYLGALVETSDGKVYAMRHNNNLWFNAKDLAISTGEFVEPHGVSRNYAYTSDMEGKTITKITYMLKDLPDEVVSCEVFLKLKTSASVSPKYEDGYHAFMAWTNLQVPLAFSDLPESADYKLSGVTFGTGRNRQTIPGCTMSGDVLIISGDVVEGTYTATFTDETYANISATIRVYTTNATDKIISADKNAAGLSFLLTPAGVCDATDAVLEAQNFVNATEYTVIASNDTAVYTSGTNQISGSGFTLNVVLNDVPSGKMGILGFSHAFSITPASVGQNDYDGMVSKILALPDIAYGWRVPTGDQLKDMGLIVMGVYPDGATRDITDYVSSGLLVMDDAIMMSFGTVLIDRAFTPSEEGKVYALSDEGEGTMSDGANDGKITATWYVRTPGGSSSGNNNGNGNSGNNSGSDNNGGNSTTTYTAPTTQPSSASEAFSNGAKDSAVREALGKLSSKVSSTTPVEIGLPASAMKGEQKVSRIESDALYLPVIEVSESKIYVFGVSLDKFNVSDELYWDAEITNSSTGEYVSASDAEEAVTFFTDEGTETTKVPANKHVNVAAYFESGKQYQPVITTSDNSGNDVRGVGGSSGGCNEGFILPVILLGIGFVLTHKR